MDIGAGERAVELMQAAVSRTRRPEVVGGLGGFAGLFALDVTRYRRPLLASSTDGVGTKIAVARALDRHDTVGIDLVAMVVDDLVVCGAEPLFLQDYVACGQGGPGAGRRRSWRGIARGCELAGCALVGGETAEHGDLMEPDAYDLAATGVGVVEADALLGPERVRAGDAVVALASSGLHSNGYSLVRRVVREAGLRLDEIPPGLDRTLGEELLEPTRIYARDCLALAAATEVHAFAHVTGGGLAGNLARVLPPALDAVLDRRHLDPAADHGPGGPARPGRARRAGAHAQPRRGDGGGASRRRRRGRAADQPRRPGLGGRRGGPGYRRGAAHRAPPALSGQAPSGATAPSCAGRSAG